MFSFQRLQATPYRILMNLHFPDSLSGFPLPAILLLHLRAATLQGILSFCEQFSPFTPRTPRLHSHPRSGCQTFRFEIIHLSPLTFLFHPAYFATCRPIASLVTKGSSPLDGSSWSSVCSEGGASGKRKVSKLKTALRTCPLEVIVLRS